VPLNPLAEALKLIKLRHRVTHFRAVVDSVSGNTIKIIRNGASAADDQFYAAAAGLAAAVSPGDEVLVEDYTGEGDYVVVIEITR
jgi:hypothetical protein